MRRNERNLMWNLDPYIQTHWQLTSALGLDAGARYSSVWFDSNDRYVVGKMVMIAAKRAITSGFRRQR
nr:hypothetical protein [Klebsiella pneumoniae]